MKKVIIFLIITIFFTGCDRLKAFFDPEGYVSEKIKSLKMENEILKRKYYDLKSKYYQLKLEYNTLKDENELLKNELAKIKKRLKEYEEGFKTLYD